MRPILGIWMAVACVGAWAVQGTALAGQTDRTNPDRLDQHFARARAELTAGQHRAARRELGKAARQLEKKVHPAAGEVKTALVKNAVALKSLSAEVDRGHVTDPRVIDAAAGRAHAAVAKFHQMRAEQRWARQKSEGAGRELRAAVHHLERGFAWLGRGTDPAVRTTTAHAMVLAGQLAFGAPHAPDDVDRGLHDVGREIDRLGWRVEPRQGRPSPARPR